MCNSFNHHPSCTCGFGGDGHAGSSYGNSHGYGLRSLSAGVTFESFIYPTSCPVCGAPVYFYRSPYDGRVFFDDLGSPWPKHPCTDSSLNKNVAHVISNDYSPSNYLNHLRPKFKEGWDLFIVDSIYRQQDTLAQILGIQSTMPKVCRGRSIKIHKQRNMLIIKKGATKADAKKDDLYTYHYSISTLELLIKEDAPFLQAGKLAYISQDLSEDMYMDLMTFEVDKKTSIVRNRTIKARLIKYKPH
jgi:hypothetical protein